MKITDIAFSSTVKASELKKIMATSSTQPITSRCARKFASSPSRGDDGQVYSRKGV
jgi:hypothetical protein